MQRTLYTTLALLCWLSLVAGCAPATQPNPGPQAEVVTLPTPTPEPTATPNNLPVAAPTELPTPEPTPPPAAVDWTTTATVEGDYYVLGNPQAPIRLIDFSDFF